MNKKNKWIKLRKFSIYLIYPVLVVLYLLYFPAIDFFPYPWSFLKIISILLYGTGIPILFYLSLKNKTFLWYITGVYLIIAVIYYSLPASNNRDWEPSVAKIPIVRFNKNGDKVIIKNIRSFKYKTENDFDPIYVNREYDMKLLDSAYYILSYWDNNKAIAHSMLSFGFKDGKFLSISVETRREKGEPQTGLRGIYNQYELIYIFADESDLLLLRTNYRNEEVFVYPLKIKKNENLKKVFLEFMHRAQKLEKYPEFYNTLKENCFLSLFKDIKKVTGEPSGLDYRMILNGYSDRMGFERDWFKTNGLPFNKFRQKHHINKYIQTDINPAENFSKKIRE